MNGQSQGSRIMQRSEQRCRLPVHLPFTAENKNPRGLFFFFGIRSQAVALGSDIRKHISSLHRAKGQGWGGRAASVVLFRSFLERQRAEAVYSRHLCHPACLVGKNNSCWRRRRQRSHPRVSDVFALLRWNDVRTDFYIVWWKCRFSPCLCKRWVLEHKTWQSKRVIRQLYSSSGYD